jgi:hypothetical protein
MAALGDLHIYSSMVYLLKLINQYWYIMFTKVCTSFRRSFYMTSIFFVLGSLLGNKCSTDEPVGDILYIQTKTNSDKLAPTILL